MTTDGASSETTTVAVGGAGAGRTTVTSTSSGGDASPSTGNPSWATGEFYAAIAPLVVAILGAVTHGAVVPGQVEKELAAIGAVVAGAYALARTMLKATHVHAQAKVAAAASMSAAAVARATPPPAAPVVTHGDADRVAEAVAAALEQRFVLRRRPTKKTARRPR
jgi:hypothetical protein